MDFPNSYYIARKRWRTGRAAVTEGVVGDEFSVVVQSKEAW